jgi:molybdate transport system substrate-binding protein
MGRAALLALVVALAGGCGPRAEDGERPLLVFAAASLTDVAAAVAGEFEQASGRSVQLGFGGSSALARQIAAGAPVDVFLSANPGWVDHLIREGRARGDDRRVFAANRLTVVVAPGRPGPGTLADLAVLKRVALADPAAVPAGIYAREMLEKAGLWAAVKPRVVPTQDVRAALALAETGAADAAIVYATDARRAPRLTEAPVVPAALQPEVRYVAVVTAHARRSGVGPAAEAFLAALTGEVGRRHLAAFGFVPPPERQR